MMQPLKLLPPALKIDKGRARPFNEDWAEYEIPQDPDLMARKGMLFVLADGMGGHERGQEASRTAVKTAISAYYGDASTDVAASLVRAFKAANGEVFGMQSRSSNRRMGTTLVAAVIRGDELHVAHVGDSRAYLVRGSAIHQLTEDHTWVADQQRAGVLTEEQARTHPQRSVITRAIGADPDVQVDTSRHRLAPGDTLLLCSDGLTGQMTDEEIKTHVTSLPPREAAQRMIDTVNQRGGFDNISVLIVKSAQPQAVPAAGRRLPLVPILGLAVLLLAVGLAAFGAWRFVNSRSGSTPPPSTVPVAVVATSTSPAAVVNPTLTKAPASPTLEPTQTEAPAGAGIPTATLRPTLTPSLTFTPRPPTSTPLPPTATRTAAPPTQGPRRTPNPPKATQPPPATEPPASPIPPKPTMPPLPTNTSPPETP